MEMAFSFSEDLYEQLSKQISEQTREKFRKNCEITLLEHDAKLSTKGNCDLLLGEYAKIASEILAQIAYEIERPIFNDWFFGDPVFTSSPPPDELGARINMGHVALLRELQSDLIWYCTLYASAHWGGSAELMPRPK